MGERKAAYLQITRKCNNECVFCSNPPFEKEYSLEEAKEQVLKFKDEGVTEILLTGGEPTIVEFLPSLISFIVKNDINPKIISNGVELFDMTFVKRLFDSGLKAINISLHTADEDVAEKLSKKEGHLKKTLVGIRNAIDIGIDVTINSTINSLNCKSLSINVQFFIDHFPEVKHYVFNNLDPGQADGYIKSRAGENPWIVAKLVDLELELSKMVRVLKKNEKTFRIERVPLCYMDGFEEFSTETRKIVKDENYVCSFIENGRNNEVRTVVPEQLSNKAKCCSVCKLNEICRGLQREYIELHGDSELYPVFSDRVEEIRRRILNS